MAQEFLARLSARAVTALLVLPLLAAVLLLGDQDLLAAALAVAATFAVTLLAVRAVTAHLLAAVVPPRPGERAEPSDTLPQNEPAAVGNPQPRAPGTTPLPC